MAEEETGAHDKFVAWLKKNMLHSYQQDLEEQGYEELESLVLLSEEEIEELSTSINMKPGNRNHKIIMTLPLILKATRRSYL